MGRMLDALKQPHGNRSRSAETTPELVAASVSAAEVAPLDAEETMPFIEVGGRQSAVEGSPDVMAQPPTRLAVVAAPPAEVVAKDPPEVAGAWAVQFRPWAGEARSIPLAKATLAAELIAYHQPEHAVSAQYQVLLQGLLGQLPSAGGRLLLFTAPAPWGGTTTVMLNLAITAARQAGRRVAVIDANLRRPALAERLGIAPTPGLRDVLAGTVPLQRALQNAGTPNLQALAAGGKGDDMRLPFDWLLPTLRQLRDQFDLVFIDAPSWNEGSEVSALAATCDAVYMVLHQPGADDAKTSPPLLRQPPSNLLGCILTVR